MNIMVTMISGIGDHVYSSVIICALRKANPHAKIVVLTKQQSADYFTNSKYVDKTIVMQYKSKSRKLDTATDKAIRREKIDVAYVMDNKNRSMIYSWLGGCKRIVAIASNGVLTSFAKFIAAEQVYPEQTLFSCHVYEKYKDIAKKITGLSCDERYIGEIPSDNLFRAAEILRHFKTLAPDYEKTLAVCMGVEGEARRWSVDKCAQVLDYCIQRNWQPYFVGSTVDSEYSQSIIDKTKHSEKIVNLCGKLSLNDLKALFKKTDAMLSLDTGPAHVAGACGVAVAVIAKTADPRNWGVLSERYIPIHEFGLPAYNPNDGIETEDVVMALEGLIAMGREV